MTRALAALVLFAALPSQALTDRSGPYEFQVLIGGSPASTFRLGGETFVLKASRTFELSHVNQLGEAVLASPALVDGHWYFRTATSLVAIGR